MSLKRTLKGKSAYLAALLVIVVIAVLVLAFALGSGSPRPGATPTATPSPIPSEIPTVAAQAAANSSLKLYWFVPDGMRADPYLFKLYAWAEDGTLPNIKKLMERGSYGYSKPVFPSHTPVNFAAMMTGTYPITNGIADGPMHAVGKPLNAVAVGGFRSVARKNKAAWSMFEAANDTVAVVSIPGSTPPETQTGVYVKGRWANWGPDFAALDFEEEQDSSARAARGLDARSFGLFTGASLAIYNSRQNVSAWSAAQALPTSYSPAFQVNISAYGADDFAYVYDSTDDNRTNYDRVAFSRDRKAIDADVAKGGISEWQPITLKFASGNLSADINTSAAYEVIKLDDDGFYKLRVIYNTLNQFDTQPASAAGLLTAKAGPMVDYVDNFPSQLVYYDEDRKAYLLEQNMSFDWHARMVPVLLDNYNPSVVIHDVYNPTQMMTSRWWMSEVDPSAKRYANYSEAEHNQSWSEILGMYKRLDGIIGEILDKSGDNTYIVLSSDHGNIPLDRVVNLNNLFAKEGWLKFSVNNKTGEPTVDWANSKVIFLKMAHVYINPDGLAGNFTRENTTAYYQLRDQVISALENLTDYDGRRPVAQIVKWEDLNATFHMPADRSGDLVIANNPGFGWAEKMGDAGLSEGYDGENSIEGVADNAINASATGDIFSTPIITGYKQAVIADDMPGMWAPFMISGPGIKKGNYLGDKPYSVIDELPTILKARGISAGQQVDGKPIDAVFEN